MSKQRKSDSSNQSNDSSNGNKIKPSVKRKSGDDSFKGSRTGNRPDKREG